MIPFKLTTDDEIGFSVEIDFDTVSERLKKNRPMATEELE